MRKFASTLLVFMFALVLSTDVARAQLLPFTGFDANQVYRSQFFQDPEEKEELCGTERTIQTARPGSEQTSTGLLSEAELIARPFTAAQWGTITPKAVVLHWTTAEYNNAQEVADVLASRKEERWPDGRALQLSVDKDGKIWQLSESLDVRPAQTFPEGAADPWNDTTIGIEIESGSFGNDIPAYEDDLLNNPIQLERVVDLTKALMDRYGIRNEQDYENRSGVFGHLEINPGNPDPGANYMAAVREALGATPTTTPATADPDNGAFPCQCSVPGSKTNASDGSKTFFIGDSLMVGMHYAGDINGPSIILNQAQDAGLSVNTEVFDKSDLRRVTGNSIEAVGGENIDGMIEYLNEHTQDFSTGNADNIVVALGTNYYGRDRKEQIRDFVLYLRDFNPTARIFWVNTKFNMQDGIDWTTRVNADISAMAAEMNYTIIDYESAVGVNPAIGPPTRGSDQIHTTRDASIGKAEFIVSEILGGGSGGQPQEISYGEFTEDQRIAQTFILGINASQANQIPAIVDKFKVGGVFILNGPNADENNENDVFDKAYFDSLSAAAGVPLIVASDEEGGRVQRFRSQIGEYPSAAVLGTLSNEEVQISAKSMGDKLAALGVNTVLGPVADLALPDSEAVTNLERGFAQTSGDVVTKVNAFTEGLEEAGLTATFKHFPGLGSTKENTDFAVGESPDIDTLRATDLVVYETLLNRNGVFVMINNAIVPGVTEEGEVYGTSSEGMRILREEYGFGGIITTDALNARGVRDVVGGLDVSVPDALAAGVTMPLFAFTGEAELQNIIDSVKSRGINVSNNLSLVASHKQSIAGGDGCGLNKLPGDTNEEIVWNFLIDKIGPLHTAAAMGNFWQESRFDPTIVNGIGATGLAQWLGGRKTLLMSRPKPLDINTQIAFAYDEFLGQNGSPKQFIKIGGQPLSGSYEEWLQTTSIEDATIFFRRAYERPGEAEANDAARIDAARGYLTRFGS